MLVLKVKVSFPEGIKRDSGEECCVRPAVSALPGVPVFPEVLRWSASRRAPARVHAPSGLHRGVPGGSIVPCDFWDAAFEVYQSGGILW